MIKLRLRVLNEDQNLLHYKTTPLSLHLSYSLYCCMTSYWLALALLIRFHHIVIFSHLHTVHKYINAQTHAVSLLKLIWNDMLPSVKVAAKQQHGKVCSKRMLTLVFDPLGITLPHTGTCCSLEPAKAPLGEEEILIKERLKRKIEGVYMERERVIQLKGQFN